MNKPGPNRPRPKKTGPREKEPVRLQKILAMAGVASRRKAEELILAGKVTVNGEVVQTLGSKADPFQDTVQCDGQPVRLEHSLVYILLNKPRGVLTTLRDDRGRKTVKDLVQKIRAPVFPVGRLDYNSEGLLILTNDGSFAQKLAHPRHQVPRTYHVKAHGTFDSKKLDKLKRGTRIEGKKLEVDRVRVIEARGKIVKLEFVLHQGINREIRTLCERAGLLVSKLKRTRVGDLGLGALKPGEYRHLKKEELPKLFKKIPKK